MPDDAEAAKVEWKKRDKRARDFWGDYVYDERTSPGSRKDVPKAMNVALSELFRKIDAAVSKAQSSGLVYFRYRTPHNHREQKTLIFSDGQGRRFQRTLKIGDGFSLDGQPMHFTDYWWLSLSLTSMIINEGRVKPDPRGGWIPDVIIENAGKLKADLEADRKGMLHLKLSVDKPENT